MDLQILEIPECRPSFSISRLSSSRSGNEAIAARKIHETDAGIPYPEAVAPAAPTKCKRNFRVFGHKRAEARCRAVMASETVGVCCHGVLNESCGA